MRIAATGFVSEKSGSVASANALLLRGLLDRGCEIVFFSKEAFVDPRAAVGQHARFTFVDVTNHLADGLRRRLQGVPLLGWLAGMVDARTYNALLVRRIADAHAKKPFDLTLWMGDFARGGNEGLPTVSFVQGPPGTDARSILHHNGQIQKLAGRITAWKWGALAWLRLSKIGLPAFDATARFIVGSEQSRKTLADYGVKPAQISVLPYPIDLNLFVPAQPRASPHHNLRCVWLGRIVPRKRLDIFLDAAALSIQRGHDIALSIVGEVGFIPGYEKLIENFPYPERLEWIRHLPREEVPAFLHDKDVLVQPSEEENFGSSVAEAQACGLPVIVGASNGNADFLSSRDIVMSNQSAPALAEAFEEMMRRREQGSWGSVDESRRVAECHFKLSTVSDRLMEILKAT